jgi:hypothetical protein
MKKLIEIFPYFCFFITFLLLAYIFYKSEIYWDGSIRDYYLVYFILIISLLILIFSICCSQYKYKEYFFILSISVVVGLYIFEGYIVLKRLAYVDQSAKIKIYESETGKKYDTRSLIKVYKDLKKDDENITINIASNFNDSNGFLSLSGISNTKTIYCNENGYYSIYESDRYGFNNPDDQWNKNKIEYLLIGDSFTIGACVNRPNDTSSVLRKLSKRNVINLAQPSQGPLIEYALLKEYSSAKFKKIIWMYYEGNDLLNLKDELNNKILKEYIINEDFTQSLKFNQKKIDKIKKETFKKLLEKLEKTKSKDEKFFSKELTKFIKLDKLRENLFHSVNKPLSEFNNILYLAKELANKNNSELYFVYLPSYDRYRVKFIKSEFKEIKKIVENLNIPFIDIDEKVFKKEENPLDLFPFRSYGHYNTLGYKKIALEIYNSTK